MIYTPPLPNAINFQSLAGYAVPNGDELLLAWGLPTGFIEIVGSGVGAIGSQGSASNYLTIECAIVGEIHPAGIAEHRFSFGECATGFVGIFGGASAPLTIRGSGAAKAAVVGTAEATVLSMQGVGCLYVRGEGNAALAVNGFGVGGDTETYPEGSVFGGAVVAVTLDAEATGYAAIMGVGQRGLRMVGTATGSTGVSGSATTVVPVSLLGVGKSATFGAGDATLRVFGAGKGWYPAHGRGIVDVMIQGASVGSHSQAYLGTGSVFVPFAPIGYGYTPAGNSMADSMFVATRQSNHQVFHAL